MGYFDELIDHLNKKKPKKGDDGYFGKPIIQERQVIDSKIQLLLCNDFI